MFRIQPEIGMSPGAISGKDMIRLIPGLRFSSNRKEQLQAEDNEQKTERSNFINLVTFSETRIHVIRTSSSCYNAENAEKQRTQINAENAEIHRERRENLTPQIKYRASCSKSHQRQLVVHSNAF